MKFQLISKCLSLDISGKNLAELEFTNDSNELGLSFLVEAETEVYQYKIGHYYELSLPEVAP